MRVSSLAVIWATGIAIFSMFFGSGNVVFPLVLGRETGGMVGYGISGLLVTAIGAPLLGLLGAVLFEGDCKKFFYRIGPIPGYLAVLLIIALIGPFGVMPRCFVVAFGAIKAYFPELSLFYFSLISGLFTLILIAKRQWLLPILGYFLSPLLIISLCVIIVVGLLKDHGTAQITLSASDAFIKGMVDGYDTMDLLASIFFAVSIWLMLKEQLKLEDPAQVKAKLVPTYILSSLVGGVLLAIMYLGLCIVTAWHAPLVEKVLPEELLSTLAIALLGSKLAVVANIAIALACFTTVMALAVTTVDVFHLEMSNTKFAKRFDFSYGWMVAVVIAITVLFSNLGFKNIMSFLHAVMVVCYPAIVVLTICNILYKLWGFKYVKIPVYTTFLITVAMQFY